MFGFDPVLKPFYSSHSRNMFEQAQQSRYEKCLELCMVRGLKPMAFEGPEFEMALDVIILLMAMLDKDETHRGKWLGIDIALNEHQLGPSSQVKWMIVSQGDERFVAVQYPRIVSEKKVVFYSTSPEFFTRIAVFAKMIQGTDQDSA